MRNYSAAVSIAVERALSALSDVSCHASDAVEALAALDHIGADLARRMESVDAEATLLRAVRESRRNRNAKH